MTSLPTLVSLVDRFLAGEVSREELGVLRAARPEDLQAIHDLIHLDAAAAGVVLRCEHE